MIPGFGGLGNLMEMLRKFKEAAKDPRTQAKAAWVNQQLGTPEDRRMFCLAMADAFRRAVDGGEGWDDPAAYLCRAVDVLCEKDPATAQALGLDPRIVKAKAAGIRSLPGAAGMMGIGGTPEERAVLEASQRLIDLLMVASGAAMQNRIDGIPAKGQGDA